MTRVEINISMERYKSKTAITVESNRDKDIPKAIFECEPDMGKNCYYITMKCWSYIAGVIAKRSTNEEVTVKMDFDSTMFKMR